jgi:hypothetical protein
LLIVGAGQKVVAKADPVVTQSKAASKGPKQYYLQPAPPPGTCYLGDVASVLRSKIAGPYEVTLDVMFPDDATYEKVKSANVLSAAVVAKLYNIPEDKIKVAMWWPNARAFKATIPRGRASAGFQETDTHGSQQHAPLLFIRLPWGRDAPKSAL